MTIYNPSGPVARRASIPGCLGSGVGVEDFWFRACFEKEGFGSEDSRAGSRACRIKIFRLLAPESQTICPLF